MNIGIICYPSYGGSGVVATELGKQLANRDHKVHFVSYEPPFRLDQYYENIYFHEVEIPSYPLFKYPPYSLALANKISELISEEELDIIHAHYAIPHSLCSYIAKEVKKEADVKVVTTLHGTDITLVGNQSSFENITKFSIEASDGITAVSENLREETLEAFDLAEDRVRTIYNFVDTREYMRTEPEEPLKLASGEDKIITHISNFRDVKNIPDVIKIFALINKEVSSKLLLIGDGPNRHQAKDLVAKLNLEDKVYFLGKQDNIIPLLSISDLFLLPSQKESFGLVSVEAMACKVPVIASDAGGIPEVVLNEVTGFLAKPGAVKEMAKKGVELLKNEEMHHEIAKNARHWVVTKFSAENIVDKYEAYYYELINN
ncbi:MULTISPECIES: N-acetyl-alpha-D-glucosaminyl L-malate synthase BshA [unclassified Candidatus Frackibacter]|uniref:N-acetyl-alpha-D-glucosaminyl L-malate synthase BshA n=1 Tax=unclassified Candidatus Frackibacter TaxID=2648818 RepID=UPI0007957307|nr:MULTISPECIES: N-acetyl-alpha-D-glucosaminyl L-malate synthase BshA [unclassified Candidatus Frackibacter]KXS44400.1 MAG: group 1 glycosyl transferase [Candidatus Frackibacter sp. T328-2]SDC70864.1 N-acetyl-alpha-D-glucosaminyl L-malate synthase BshA [Candidatus Frackibacter sp. WG11]SEM84657.1 N-acetyl-alpha-D-glucosaminyl L-malate synthase BshA [Candidatus Frackibacter sp. WG12]SFL93895.1 N-acetyl-alpha-D-glucosaminyl L-malate synthase BshA [Candidatus Frackibacter sp. WG13]